MREKYYSDEIIDFQAKKFMEILIPYNKKYKFKINLPTAALLVIDMQKYFLDKNSHAYIPSAEAIIPRIKKLIELFLANNLLVIETRHINTKKNAMRMLDWWGEIITEQNPFSEIIDVLKNKKIKVINKSQYDAFFKTDLDIILKKNKIKQVIITGVLTHLCCETTARNAFMHGYDVFFVVDATATYNTNFHISTCLNLSNGFAVPILTEEI